MNPKFNAAEISDHENDSHGITRFIAALSADEARACIDHELNYGSRKNVLALLSAQISAKQPAFPGQPVSKNPLHLTAHEDLSHLSAGAHAQILSTLQLARAHARFPLDGKALAELRADLDASLALLGVR